VQLAAASTQAAECGQRLQLSMGVFGADAAPAQLQTGLMRLWQLSRRGGVQSMACQLLG
jgi:hypothetical protein